MSYVVDIINSPNFVHAFCACIIIIVIAWLLSKSGLLTVHTKYVTLGMADKERNIIRQQKIYAKQSCDAFGQYIPKKDGYNEWRGRCIAEYVFDEMVDWIVLNHIESTDRYIQLRQNSVWNIIQANVEKPEHSTEEFKEAVFKKVAEDIKALEAIRKQYS